MAANRLGAGGRLGLAALTLAACASTGQKPAAAPAAPAVAPSTLPPVTLGEPDTGRRVEIALGQELLLRLPSAGEEHREWKVTAPAAGILAMVGAPALVASPVDGGMGSGGIQVWRWKAIARGEARLALEQRGTGDAGAARSVAFDLVVR